MLPLSLCIFGIIAVVQSAIEPDLTQQTLAVASRAETVSNFVRDSSGGLITDGFHDPTTQPSRGGKSICVSGQVPVLASASNVKLSFHAPSNIVEATQDLLSFVVRGSSYVQSINKGVQSATDTYDIYASLCYPHDSINVTTIQFLTHGLGFDNSYWDYSNYSYVDAATAAGYATFLYDRLGNGRSSKPDPISVIQAPLQVAIAEQLIAKLRDGQFSGRKFSKIATIGHSYGSVITQAVVANLENKVDAAVFTGFSANFTGIPPFLLDLNLDIASHADPLRFGDLPTGFLLPSNTIGWQLGFFTWPNFGLEILSKVASIGSTITFGELFSRGAITKPTTNFTGPVYIINGDADLPYCSGNCSSPMDKAKDALRSVFPLSRNATSYLLPETGHAINFHYSAQEAFGRIQDFLNENVLRS